MVFYFLSAFKYCELKVQQYIPFPGCIVAKLKHHLNPLLYDVIFETD